MAAEMELRESLLLNEDGVEMSHTPAPKRFFSPRMVIGIIVGLAVVGVIVGAVGATGKFSSGDSKSSSSSSSGSGSSLMTLWGSSGTYPIFAVAPVASLSPGSSDSLLTSSYSYAEVTPDGRRTALNYTVERELDIVSLQYISSIVGVACTPTSLIVTFSTTTAAQNILWRTGTFLTLSSTTRCGNFLRQVVTTPVVAGVTLTVTTKNATLNKLFKHANVTFVSQHSPQAPSHTLAPVQHSPSNVHRRGFFSDLLGGVESGLSTVAEDTVNAVGGISGLVNDLVTGGANIDITPFQQSYSLPSTSCTPTADPSYIVGTTACAGTLSVTTEITLVITDYTFVSFSTSVTTDYDLSVSMSNFGVNFAGQWSDNVQLWTETFSSSSLSIAGVVLPLNLVLAVNGAYSASGDASLVASASYEMSGSATATMTYTPSAGIVWTHDQSMTPTGTSPTVTQSANGVLTVSLLPTFSLEAFYIGYASGQVTGTAELDATTTSTSCTGIATVMNANVMVTVGANLSIDLVDIYTYSHVWPAETIYSDKIPIETSCLATGSILTTPTVGMTWNGLRTWGEFNSLTSTVSMQLTDSDNMYFSVSADILLDASGSDCAMVGQYQLQGTTMTATGAQTGCASTVTVPTYNSVSFGNLFGTLSATTATGDSVSLSTLSSA